MGLVMKILLEVKDSKADYALEFLKHISFIKKVEVVAKNQITNAAILESIEKHEPGKKKK
ncbi:MAG: hypothetical protein WDM90_09180 [Ferruginibacter sp.]